MLLSLGCLTSLFPYVPKAALAAVIIVAVAPLCDTKIVRTLWRVKSTCPLARQHGATAVPAASPEPQTGRVALGAATGARARAAVRTGPPPLAEPASRALGGSRPHPRPSPPCSPCGQGGGVTVASRGQCSRRGGSGASGPAAPPARQPVFPAARRPWLRPAGRPARVQRVGDSAPCPPRAGAFPESRGPSADSPALLLRFREPGPREGGGPSDMGGSRLRPTPSPPTSPQDTPSCSSDELQVSAEGATWPGMLESPGVLASHFPGLALSPGPFLLSPCRPLRGCGTWAPPHRSQRLLLQVVDMDLSLTHL